MGQGRAVEGSVAEPAAEVALLVVGAGVESVAVVVKLVDVAVGAAAAADPIVAEELGEPVEPVAVVAKSTKFAAGGTEVGGLLRLYGRLAHSPGSVDRWQPADADYTEHRRQRRPQGPWQRSKKRSSFCQVLQTFISRKVRCVGR